MLSIKTQIHGEQYFSAEPHLPSLPDLKYPQMFIGLR